MNGPPSPSSEVNQVLSVPQVPKAEVPLLQVLTEEIAPMLRVAIAVVSISMPSTSKHATCLLASSYIFLHHSLSFLRPLLSFLPHLSSCLPHPTSLPPFICVLIQRQITNDFPHMYQNSRELVVNLAALVLLLRTLTGQGVKIVTAIPTSAFSALQDLQESG